MSELAGAQRALDARPAGGRGAAVLPLAVRALRIERDGRRLLDGIDLCLAGQGLSVIMGPNGAGKSLLLRVMAGLVTADSGTVCWAGRPPDRARATRLGFVFQKPVMLRRSVRANVEFSLGAAGMAWRARRATALVLLTEAGLGHLAALPARLLSGGEQQRVALLRALATDPQVLLLDEPSASLDPAATQAIESMLRQACGQGTRVLLVTHDPAQAQRLADEVLFMHHGRFVEQAAAAAFFAAPQHGAARDYLAGRLLV